MKEIKQLLVRDVYKTISLKPTVIPENTKLEDVIRAIIKDPVTRSVYVIDNKQKFIGFITVLQLLRLTLIREGGALPRIEETKEIFQMETTLRIDEVMHPPIFVYEDDNLLKILGKMLEEKVQELPVVSKEEKIIGDLNCLEILKGFWKI